MSASASDADSTRPLSVRLQRVIADLARGWDEPTRAMYPGSQKVRLPDSARLSPACDDGSLPSTSDLSLPTVRRGIEAGLRDCIIYETVRNLSKSFFEIRGHGRAGKRY